MVTGARINSAKGLFNPPVKNNKKLSCDRSNNNVSIASRSDRRWFSGKIVIATRFDTTDAPMARKQSPNSILSPS